LNDVAKVRALAEKAGYRLVQGKGRTVGRHDYGRYGLEATTGHKAFGFGNRGVVASLQEVERFLSGGGEQVFSASLKASKRRKPTS
jgi:hypothetical protein